MPRRRVIRRTMGKDAIKKSSTLIANVGPATTPVFAFSLLTTSENRSTDGATQTIRDEQNTEVLANVGDILKYVNIKIQCGARDETPEDDTSGWLEWAVVKYKEGLVVPTTTNLGVKTLGDVCTKMFRGDCLLTGALPVGGDQPNVQDILIKVPKVLTKVQIGTKLILYCAYRSVNAASVSTQLVRLVTSCNYKLYV